MAGLLRMAAGNLEPLTPSQVRTAYAASLGIVLSTNRNNRVLRVPATKIDKRNSAISIDCWIFVFTVQLSP
jgi:hypothetical protein